MPTYTYKTEDGEVIERLYKASDRPQLIHLADGRTAHFIIAPVARLNRGWSSFGIYGVNGTYNKTLGAWITSDRQHDDLCKEKGLNRITDTRDFDRISSERAKLDEKEKKIEADIKRYETALAETKDHHQAYQIAYGEEDALIARQATNEIFERYPEAKAIPTELLEQI